MDARLPGVVCRVLRHLPIDEGTLGRFCSPVPGTVGGRATAGNVDVGRSRFNHGRAAAYAEKNAHSTSQGRCARYVVAAVAAGFGVIDEEDDVVAASVNIAAITAAGALPSIAVPSEAKNYGAVLEQLGFRAVVEMPEDGSRSVPGLPENYTATAGDVVIFQPVDGVLAGHMQIFTGTGWVSDFRQKTILPHSDPAKGWSQVEYSIYRHEE